MTFWILIWIVCVLLTIIFCLQEGINGSYEWRFWVCAILILFLILSIPICSSIYRESLTFYQDFVRLKAVSQNLTAGQEHSILAMCIEYNHKLDLYQSKFSFLYPHFSGLNKLTHIELRHYNLNNYTWWG